MDRQLEALVGTRLERTVGGAGLIRVLDRLVDLRELDERVEDADEVQTAVQHSIVIYLLTQIVAYQSIFSRFDALKSDCDVNNDRYERDTEADKTALLAIAHLSEESHHRPEAAIFVHFL